MSVSKLVMNFAGSNGDTTISYNYVRDDAGSSDIKALVNGLITNGSIFANPPVSAKSAKIVTTSETVINLGD